jgi:hypothetical protein
MTDWLSRMKRLESAIASRVECAPRHVPAPSPRQPIETLHAVVDAIEREVLPAGRGRSVFPFTEVRVSVVVASAREEARLGAAFDAPPSLQTRVIERLTRTGCTVPDLSVRVMFVPDRQDSWIHPDFHVDYVRSTPPAEAPAVVLRLELTVTHGTADRETYVFDAAPVMLGRGSEVRDHRQRLLRTNHVAFIERGGEINDTVSRRHARIEHDAKARLFRLHDDTGADATSVIREGRGLQVPRGRGLVLQSGDVIVLGRARLRVTIEDAERRQQSAPSGLFADPPRAARAGSADSATAPRCSGQR